MPLEYVVLIAILILILLELKSFNRIKKVEKIMSTVPSGLAALQQSDDQLKQAVTDNTTASAASNQKIIDLVGQLANNEDPAVQNIAADILAQANAIAANTKALQDGLAGTPVVTT